MKKYGEVLSKYTARSLLSSGVIKTVNIIQYIKQRFLEAVSTQILSSTNSKRALTHQSC